MTTNSPNPVDGDVQATKSRNVTQSYLKSLMSYDPITGVFTRLKTMGGQVAGSVAGSINSEGYTLISIHGKSYKAARLAHLYMTGEMPKEADHKNRVRSDDRWENIREATHGQNGANKNIQKNNTSGSKCVCWDKNMRSWAVQLSVNGKRKQIGRFKDLELAELVAEESRIKYYGEFATGSYAREVKND